MKIFDWMNRMLRHNEHSTSISVHKDKYLSMNVEKLEPTGSDNETLALLKHGGGVASVDMFANRRLDGFLTIGTLCIAPLHDNNVPFEKIEDEEIVVEEEICHQYHDAYHDVGNESNDTSSQVFLGGNEIEMAALMNEAGCPDGRRPWIIAPTCKEMKNLVVDHGALNSNEKENKGRKNVERVTLADLFLADPHPKLSKTMPNSDDVVTCAKKPPTSNYPANKGFSIAKKKLAPYKIINEHLKHFQRMMKKKIHPDFHGKFQENDESQMNVVEIATSDDRVSLLPDQGIMG